MSEKPCSDFLDAKVTYSLQDSASTTTIVRGHCSNLLKVPNVKCAFFSQGNPVIINSS